MPSAGTSTSTRAAKAIGVDKTRSAALETLGELLQPLWVMSMQWCGRQVRRGRQGLSALGGHLLKSIWAKPCTKADITHVSAVSCRNCVLSRSPGQQGLESPRPLAIAHPGGGSSSPPLYIWPSISLSFRTCPSPLRRKTVPLWHIHSQIIRGHEMVRGHLGRHAAHVVPASSKRRSFLASDRASSIAHTGSCALLIEPATSSWASSFPVCNRGWWRRWGGDGRGISWR